MDTRTRKVESMKKKKKTTVTRQRRGGILDYVTGSVPAAFGNPQRVARPKIVSTPRGTIVENSESLALLTSSGTSGGELVLSIPLHVRSASLPWLTQVGALYSKYRVLSMSIRYEPVCATTIGGEIAHAIVYDENDSETSGLSISRILQIAGNQRCPVWSPSALVMYDKSKAAQPWYYSQVNPPASTVANLSVAGWGVFGYQSSAVSTALGRVMVHYRVELVDPVSPLSNS